MGTRNLTIVKSKGKTKIAQYGQWDGYPTGQGQTIADFLKEADLEKFKKQVDDLKEYSVTEIKQQYKKAGHTGGDWVDNKVAKIFKEANPALDRDYGAGILKLIHDGVVTKVHLDEDFKNDGLYCEYSYELDLDNETVTMNNESFTFKQWTRKNKMQKLEQQEE